ncbi:Na+/H+ antiporter NhaA [Gordonia sp. Z-3]|uniref:Na+/H+ antiporter NhaA n=1 Tax=Gordonia sp. Z-3 TaxID=3115408 RepID=UPI002E2BD4D1|nr:Na+/H+ antiporter NhaA [Gordonia sp. Z-3]MED5803851.1 Na+/H+ antiporter NhaA [Gordonia sp. Z-3]
MSITVDDALRRRRRRNRLFNNETYAAIALLAATIAALIWANVGTGYDAFWHTSAAITVGGSSIDLTLHEWVDEGLMALFFFMVGLDVRREFSLGDLRLPGRAVLPVAAALGGLVVPAVTYLVIAGRTEAADAWGVVISTDTAFALGALALIGPRNAPRLRLFVLALAVIDDIGALTVIGLVYTDELDVVALLWAAVCLAGIWLLQRLGVWRLPPYAFLGVLTWYAVYESGVHATLAGVLIALLMPVRSLRRHDLENATEIFHLFRQAPTPGTALAVRDSLVYAIPLNQRLSAALPRYVNYIVVPLFALANAGMHRCRSLCSSEYWQCLPPRRGPLDACPIADRPPQL